MEKEGKPALPGFLLPWLVGAVSTYLTVAVLAGAVTFYFADPTIVSVSPVFLPHIVRYPTTISTKILWQLADWRFSCSRGRYFSSPTRWVTENELFCAMTRSLCHLRKRECIWNVIVIECRELRLFCRENNSWAEKLDFVLFTLTIALLPRGWKFQSQRRVGHDTFGSQRFLHLKLFWQQSLLT